MRGVQSFQGPCSATSALKTGYRPSILCASCARWSMPCSASMSAEFEAVYARMKRASNEAAKVGKCALRRLESDAAGGGAALVCTFSTAC